MSFILSNVGFLNAGITYLEKTEIFVTLFLEQKKRTIILAQITF